jgi:hypothetical protein
VPTNWNRTREGPVFLSRNHVKVAGRTFLFACPIHERREVARTTMARIIIELAITSPVWAQPALDDAEEEWSD